MKTFDDGGRPYVNNDRGERPEEVGGHPNRFVDGCVPSLPTTDLHARFYRRQNAVVVVTKIFAALKGGVVEGKLLVLPLIRCRTLYYDEFERTTYLLAKRITRTAFSTGILLTPI